jgi:hypothetical protein
MRRPSPFFFVLFSTSVIFTSSLTWADREQTDLVHREVKFEFNVKAPLERVAPLFGAHKERAWSPLWDPRFIHPTQESDRRGMVFTVAHPHADSVWVNTDAQTHVAVEYDRTALAPEANGHVLQLSDEDRSAGPDWAKQIDDYLTHAGGK